MSCEFLEVVKDQAKEGLSGRNLEGFLLEVGVGVHRYVLFSFPRLMDATDGEVPHCMDG